MPRIFFNYYYSSTKKKNLLTLFYKSRISELGLSELVYTIYIYIYKLFSDREIFVLKPVETNILDDREMNVNECINIFSTDAIIESIIPSAVVNEAGYSLSSIIPHNVSMNFARREG